MNIGNEDDLDDVKFYSDSEEISAEESLMRSHDPNILYYHIKDKKQKLNQDLMIEAEDYEEELRIFGRVDIFQSTMQYIEEFMLYFLSSVKGEDDLVKNLTKTRVKEVKHFFEYSREESEEQYFKKEDINEKYSDIIAEVFGYSNIENFEPVEDEDYDAFTIGPNLPEEKIREIKNRSVESIIEVIRSIARYYLFFENAYNAAKHGKRVVPYPKSEIEIEQGEKESSVLVEADGYVSFLCKDKNGNVYLFNYPSGKLLDESMSINDKVHRLFSYQKRISMARINEETSVKVTFFGMDEYLKNPGKGSEVNDQRIKFTNPSSSTYILNEEELADLDTSGPSNRKLAARLTIEGSILNIHTEFDEETSDEYPIMVSFSISDQGKSEPYPEIKTNISFSFDDLDVLQLRELQRIREAANRESINQMDVHLSDKEEPVQLGVPASFNLPNFDEHIDLDATEIDNLANSQYATGRKIPIPLHISKGQREILDSLCPSEMKQEEINSSYLFTPRTISSLSRSCHLIGFVDRCSRRLGSL